jgi:hypothetical protein
MPRRRRRALRRIEQSLITSDPRLARLSAFFIELAENEKMPVVEKVSRWPARLFASSARRAMKAAAPKARIPRPSRRNEQRGWRYRGQRGETGGPWKHSS